MEKVSIPLAAAAFFIAELSLEHKRVLVLAPEGEAGRLHRELKTFTQKAFFLPPWDVDPESGLMPSASVLRERLKACEALESADRLVLITTCAGFMQGVCDPEWFLERVQVVVKGSTLNRDEFARELVESGYNRVSIVESPGGFSLRGDVVDIYPINANQPHRIELWGDEVESIRTFDPSTQLSTGEVSVLTIHPYREEGFVPLEAEAFDLVVAVEPEALEAEAEDASFWFGERVVLPQAHVIVEESLDEKGEVETGLFIDAALKGERRIEHVVSGIRELLKKGLKGFVIAEGPDRVKPLSELFAERGLTARATAYKRGLVRSGLYILTGRLREGFLWRERGVFFITEKELFGRRKTRRRKRRKEKGELISSLRSLSVGDYVIHKEHGIGRFLGLKKSTVDGITREFAVIEYRDGDTLYVPVDKLNQVQKYIGAEGEPPRIDKLGGTTWRRAREKVKKEVERFVRELLEIQAKRKLQKGFAFSPDTPWQREFEEAFPFEETPDQMKAIEDVKRDMEDERPMDRLICGDVGFGKTEIAMRAAFKAVMDSKQVAVLVPTTVLAEQHYETFKERFKDFPVRVEVLSRFKGKKEQERVIEGLKRGEVDIVIGTHRLLSDDVRFRDLGLVIIDEEHKFGVRQKEKLKKLKANIDVLTLSATPIPRTLNMALSGLKDISIIETPPEGRSPVKTFVASYKKETLKRAIARELKRGGSVFVVQNRIEGLEELADTVKSLCPGAKVEMAHGRMKAAQLEKVMHRFVKGEIDVLVSTAIVESGLDIPNANTLVVVGAERFGLSQLYQLRGRVGRGNETAYAYFLVTPGAVTPEAKKRLRALQEFSELGSGLRLALRDMEIRGVGNILGKEQSGHVAGVGLEEYLNLLEEAVAKLKGKPRETEIEPHITVFFEAYIPDHYIGDENVKMAIYRRLMGATPEEIGDIREEIRDRFGQPPEEVEGLIILSELKALCKRLGIVRLQQRKSGFVMEFVHPEPAEGLASSNRLFILKSQRVVSTPKGDPKWLCSALREALESNTLVKGKLGG